MKNINKCCFTGHRPQKLPFRFEEPHPECIRLKSRIATEIEQLIVEQNVFYFICGMALGVDTFCAESVFALKEKYPQIMLESAIPCAGQELK